jgi:hypothetical protein
MDKSNKGRIIWITVLIVLGVLIVAEARTQFIKRWINDVVYDNRVPSLRCGELPPLAEVEQTAAAHQDVIEQIEAIQPGHIRVYVSGVSSCPEKGILVIEYASHANREQIEALIGETFFGVPWKGLNL